MTPTRRRPTTPAGKVPTRATPKDGEALLGPGGEPLAEAPPTEPAPLAPEEDVTLRPTGHHGVLFPGRVWPD